MTFTEIPTADAAAAAAELYSALVTEAAQWADDGERALVERFDQMPAAHVFDIISAHHLVPDHLQSAMVGALAVLDPAEFGAHLRSS